MLRRPAVAGRFYDGTWAGLSRQVDQYIVPGLPLIDAAGVMVPHAGLIYSGEVAGLVYSSVSMPHTFIMLGPNHTGLGAAVSVMDDGDWEVPNGRFGIDRRLSGKVLQAYAKAERDHQAHSYEHSLEVQLPFIARLSDKVLIVPVALMQMGLDDCEELASAIASAVRSADYPVTILASSDMSHYEPDRVARRLDAMAIDRILAMDAGGLYETVRRERISMCGVVPATVMLLACSMLGAKGARLVKYMTSGDVSGDYDSVVGYAGVVVSG